MNSSLIKPPQLDRFAMSTTIDLQPATRQSFRQFLSPRQSPAGAAAPSANGQMMIPPDLIPTLCRFHQQTYIAPKLSLYISDLFYAARHHPKLDGTFITARARKDVEPLVKAGRLILGDLTGVEIIRELVGSRRNENTNKEEEDPSSGPEPEPEGHEENEKATPSDDQDQLLWQPTLDVSEADIGRIVPRILSHRLSVRHGPEDELLGSVLYGAVRGDNTEERVEEEQTTVKDILVQILSDV